ncbi:hypothetical protein [Curtobacterium aurantiacum]|uniref:hypothetical protein n=1 Tax=Curtobacterium aurantiacum TaxID=3236919 RepID=UPI001BDE6B98|nr:hypothetical protein [Curtobacterium flaccumfaciens]MBT1678043.1 hypothetical protein [Curtobacterium flaccumfaciens pv. flaccumfaciens]
MQQHTRRSDRIHALLTAGLRGREWATPVVLAATLLVLTASVARTFSSMPLASVDESAHVDYVLRVWHGQLPVLLDGIRFRPGFGGTPPVQWVAQHPPLYYVLLAPVIGPLVDAGHPVQAVVFGRLCNAVFAAAVVPSAAWAASRCFPGVVRLPGTVAVVTASTSVLVVQGGVVYNDSLAALTCALACGVAGAALRSGVGPGLAVGGALVAAAGTTTRLTFALWLVAMVVAFALARTVRLGRLHGLAARALVAAVPLAAAAAASGWFWLRNQALTGSFSGRPTAWPGYTPRPHWSEVEIVSMLGFWRQLFALFRGALPIASPLPWVLLLLPVLLFVAALVARRLRPRGPADEDRWPRRLVVAMLVVVTLLFVVVEIRYAAGGGAPLNRYTLTVLVPIALAMAAGFLAWGRIGTWTALAWAVAAFVPTWSLFDAAGSELVGHSGTVVVLASVAAAVCAAATVVLYAIAARSTAR